MMSSLIISQLMLSLTASQFEIICNMSPFHFICCIIITLSQKPIESRLMQFSLHQATFISLLRYM